MRPNIRVEIQNNLAENKTMEVDENEEGEIMDSEDKDVDLKERIEHISESEPNESSQSLFLSGFTVEDSEKLLERAKRFQLNPTEIKNFTEDNLNLLQSSLGITTNNELNVRYEVIHMRGIDQMTASEILEYFIEYAPASLEWVDEQCCNVVWLEKAAAARALHFISKPVRGMPVRDDTSYFDQLTESNEDYQSILVINKNREVHLEEEDSNKLLNEENSVDISEITTAIPPGYWRLGRKHDSAKALLLRFALKTDKQCYKTEHFSRYYKNQRKTAKKPHGIFGRNRDMAKEPGENPWSTLAKNWDEDSQFRELERIPDEPVLQTKNSSLKVRLGSKRKEVEPEVDETETAIEPPKKIKIPRMRMYADEEEEKMKRKTMLKKIDATIKQIDDGKPDLRSLLNMASRPPARSTEKAFDLGTTLKNRNRKMVFHIKSEQSDEEPTERTVESQRPKSQSYWSKSSKEREKLVSRRIQEERRRPARTHHYDDDDDNDDEDDDFGFRSDKPKSKVAVVIRTQKQPTVRSAVASAVRSRNISEIESDSDSSIDSESSSGSESDQNKHVGKKLTDRIEFRTKSKTSNPLKIEISNNRFRRSN